MVKPRGQRKRGDKYFFRGGKGASVCAKEDPAMHELLCYVGTPWHIDAAQWTYCISERLKGGAEVCCLCDAVVDALSDEQLEAHGRQHYEALTETERGALWALIAINGELSSENLIAVLGCDPRWPQSQAKAAAFRRKRWGAR
jgi:hypothetical protein